MKTPKGLSWFECEFTVRFGRHRFLDPHCFGNQTPCYGVGFNECATAGNGPRQMQPGNGVQIISPSYTCVPAMILYYLNENPPEKLRT
jgi:hypothetical protein